MIETVENTFGIDIIPENDDQRLEALKRYQLLDTPPEEAFTNLAHLVANYFNVPIALISLVDKYRVHFKGNVGMPGVKSLDRGKSLCSLAVLSPEPTIIDKPLDDPCLLANPLVHGNFGLRFYAGAPITTPDGFHIGTVCIVDKHEKSFSEKDRDQLVRFSKVVMHQIEQRLAALQQVNHHKLAASELESRVKERTKELEEANDQLQKINADLEQFTYVSHHDLQEPIRKILLYTDMVRSDKENALSPASNARLEKVTAAAQRMSTALKEVLNFASLQKADQWEPVPLGDVVVAVLSDLEVVISEKGALVTIEPLPVVRAIPYQMHQLFYNLINNALKFHKPGEAPQIKIGYQQTTVPDAAGFEAKGKKLFHEISVQDNGIGFQQQYADKIFTLFQRLHAKTDYAGTGIGLALVKKVATNHGGFVVAEGKEGQGATFKLLLPMD